VVNQKDFQEDAITGKLSSHNSRKMYAMYSQDNMLQVHSKTMMGNSLESKMQCARQRQESIESGGGRCEQESQPCVSSELVADIQSLAKQSRRVGSRKAAASINSKRHALHSSEQLQFSMEESCNGLQELVIGVSMEWKNSCEPIQESRTNQHSALVTGSESCRLAMNDSTLQPVQETNHRASTRLVAGTVELSSTLQTEPCRLATNDSTLQPVQEINYHASTRLVAGTVELSSTLQTEPCRLAMNDSTLQPVQEINYHASAKLVAGTIELFTLQTEPCRLAMNDSTLQPVQETNHRASTKLVAGTIELYSIEYTVEDHHKRRSLKPQNA